MLGSGRGGGDLRPRRGLAWLEELAEVFGSGVWMRNWAGDDLGTSAR